MSETASENSGWALKVRLVVAGYACPDTTISSLLEMTPDRSWHVGEPTVPGALTKHNDNGWALESSAGASLDLETAVRQLLDRIPRPEAFSRLPDGVEVVVGCVIFVYSDWPYLGLSDSVVRRLATIGAGLDFDLYPPD